MIKRTLFFANPVNKVLKTNSLLLTSPRVYQHDGSGLFDR